MCFIFVHTVLRFEIKPQIIVKNPNELFVVLVELGKFCILAISNF